MSASARAIPQVFDLPDLIAAAQAVDALLEEAVSYAGGLDFNDPRVAPARERLAEVIRWYQR